MNSITCADGTILPSASTRRIHRAEHQYVISNSNHGQDTTALFTRSKQCQMGQRDDDAPCTIVDAYNAVYRVSRSQAAKILRTWRATTAVRAPRTTMRRYVSNNELGKADSIFCAVYCTKRPQ